jgi:putative oxidoreductase
MLILHRKQNHFTTINFTIMKITTLIARILFAMIFLMSGTFLFSADASSYAAYQGVPMAKFLVPLSGVLSITGALSIMLGYKTRIGALLIVLFLVPVSIAMHPFWNVADQAARQSAMTEFLKNLSMLGAALFFFVEGAGAYSLDSRKTAKISAAKSI